MNNSATKFLELMGIGVFNADGTPKYMSELINEIKSGEKTPNQVRKEYEDATPIANKIVDILANEDIDFYTAERVIELVERGIKTLKLKK